MPIVRQHQHFVQLSDFERGRIIGMREATFAKRNCSSCKPKCVNGIEVLVQMVRGRVQHRRRGSGRPRRTTDREERRLRLLATRDRFSTTRSIANDWMRDCGCSFAEMSTIGHAAFAVCKVRQNNEKMITKMQSIDLEKDKFYDEQHNTQQYTPMKYNSKMMNSIWGMYNRYSVHNFKKNIDHKIGGFAASQQSQSVGPAASGAGVERSTGDQKTAKSPQLFPSFWAPFDFSS
ncbi:hypothetical protein MML48_8g00004980 [Holotrichia oblita]|uniref:Uncharacterized protein n=1 Tax=Holotrichia oblita TaxID=644536 RepID=A0ACB9SMN8_HOLOL|nr:hypothetical protein MML48_8g00004980 [Holotrichia oblita]